MPAIGHRRTTALLLVVSLLAAAAPATAASQGPAPEPALGSSVLQSLSSWLSARWPELGPVFPWGSAREGLRSDADPEGAPKAAGDDPTADPQLGPDADPNG